MDVPRDPQVAGVARETGGPPPRWERVAATTGLVAALCALPLPPIGSGPEIAATLAVSAVIALGGVRWALALVAATEALLVATFGPFLIAGSTAGDAGALRVIGAVACAAALPGLWWIGRAAPHALELVGVEPTPSAARAARRVLAAGALALIALPLF